MLDSQCFKLNMKLWQLNTTHQLSNVMFKRYNHNPIKGRVSSIHRLVEDTITWLGVHDVYANLCIVDEGALVKASPLSLRAISFQLNFAKLIQDLCTGRSLHCQVEHQVRPKKIFFW